MAMLLIGWHDKHLAYPMPLLHCCQLKNIFWEYSCKYMFMFSNLKCNKIFPFFGFLINKRYPINIKQEQYLKSLFIWYELFIIPKVSINLKMLISSIIFMNFFSSWYFECWLLCLSFMKLWFFHKMFTPSIKTHWNITFLLI